MKQIDVVCSLLLFITHTGFSLDVVVTSNQDPAEIGKITLRDAINQVNNSGDASNAISFNLGGADTIIFLDATAGLLPTIVNQVTINGIDQVSQKMVFIDGSNLTIEDGSGSIEVGALHFSDNGITSAAQSMVVEIGVQNFTDNFLNNSTLSGIFFDGTAVDCTVNGCTVQNLVGQRIARGIFSTSDIRNIVDNTINNCFGQINYRGIFIIGTIAGNCSRNNMSDLQALPFSVGRVRGIDIGIILGSCSYNTIKNVIGNGSVGININMVLGSCSYNIIDNIQSNGGTPTIGIRMFRLQGDCSNNTIMNLVENGEDGLAQFPSQGITIRECTPNSAIVCNTIRNLSGAPPSLLFQDLVFGIGVETADDILIAHNVIDSVNSSQGIAQGIFANTLTNSVISGNTITNISTPNNTGYGITLLEDSIGNDILNNRISEIDGKAINIIDNGGVTDGEVVLQSVDCSDGCKVHITGQIIPFTSESLFLIQFFVSDNNIPEQAQTFIGQSTHNTASGFIFKVTLSELPPISAGQFITATATALFDGSQENLNTSEVSNAIPSCETFSNFCECPQEKPEPLPCPAVSCGEFIL